MQLHRSELHRWRRGCHIAGRTGEVIGTRVATTQLRHRGLAPDLDRRIHRRRGWWRRPVVVALLAANRCEHEQEKPPRAALAGRHAFRIAH